VALRQASSSVGVFGSVLLAVVLRLLARSTLCGATVAEAVSQCTGPRRTARSKSCVSSMTEWTFATSHLPLTRAPNRAVAKYGTTARLWTRQRAWRNVALWRRLAHPTRLLLFVDYIATKHGMYEVLNSIVGGTSELYSASTAQVKLAISKLVDRAVTSGDIRLDLEPLDLLRALAGVANTGLGSDGERAAKRLVDILIAGVRTQT
jgi:hypothetical protein